jgi:hypothetical protein
MTRGLVYYSRKKRDLPEDELQELVEFASHRNQSMNVSGFLTLNKKYYVQYLEGSNTSLESLMDSIRRDKRHEVINEVTYQIEQKLCSDWTMRYLSDANLGNIQFPDLMINLLNLEKSKAFDTIEIHRLVQRLVKNWAKTWQL